MAHLNVLNSGTCVSVSSRSPLDWGRAVWRVYTRYQMALLISRKQLLSGPTRMTHMLPVGHTAL